MRRRRSLEDLVARNDAASGVADHDDPLRMRPWAAAAPARRSRAAHRARRKRRLARQHRKCRRLRRRQIGAARTHGNRRGRHAHGHRTRGAVDVDRRALRGSGDDARDRDAVRARARTIAVLGVRAHAAAMCTRMPAQRAASCDATAGQPRSSHRKVAPQGIDGGERRQRSRLGAQDTRTHAHRA